MIAVTNSAITATDKPKYTHPIPNRNFIIGLIHEHGRPMSRQQLSQKMSLTCNEEREGLKRRLRAMERDGQISFEGRRGYSLIHEEDLITGRVIGHRDGFGFLVRDEGGDDLLLNKRQMLTLFDGDIIKVHITGTDSRGREMVRLVKVLERNTSEVVGTLRNAEDNYYITVENDRIAHEIDIDPMHLKGAREGQYVLVKLTDYPCATFNAYGRVIEVLGDEKAPDIEIDVTMREHGIPHAWSQEATKSAEELGEEVAEPDKLRRADLRKLPFVTIDGDDAMDFDDAVYCEPLGEDGWRLFVAIADVSHYVKPDSALDQEAQNRGSSVYFPGRVVPMLPEALSNGLCSLNPNVDRLVMVCEMVIDEFGHMTDYRFSEAVIHSHARLTYTQVNAVLTEPSAPQRQLLLNEHADLIPHLQELHRLYEKLRKGRTQRGSIDFDSHEIKFQFDKQRKVTGISPLERNVAHMLIEECMLCANQATARFLQKLKIPALFRNHMGPQNKKLESLRAYLKQKGLSLGGDNTPTPMDYDELMSQIKQRPDERAIQSMMLRSLSQAEYSVNNIGHFGLAYNAYAHFTSPIRRYPDLLVHRAIRSVIRAKESGGTVQRLIKSVIGKGMDPVRRQSNTPLERAHTNYPYNEETMRNLGEQCSRLSRRADKASWDVEAWYKCSYMQGAIGDCFNGTITSVTRFGLFVELNETRVEGLVQIGDLTGDFYQFDEAKQCLWGQRSNKGYAIGDRIDIKVARVDMERKNIEFILANP